jgi:dienelactone hydrolase
MASEVTSLLKEPEMGEGPKELPYPGLLKELSRQALERRPCYDYRGRSAQEVQARIRQVRSALRKCLGLPPGALPARPTRVIERPAVQLDGLSIRPLAIERGSGWYVTAHLYLPDGLTRPAPAVLHVHGHSYDGKSAPFYARRCRGLARRGFVALFVDFPEADERKGTGHALWYPVLAGITLQGIMIEDNSAAVTYLSSLPFVDPARIGVTGSSGGGNQTAFFAALDERVAAAAPCNAPCMIAEHCAHGSDAYCHCEAVPGMVGAGLEYHDLLAAAAPRAVRVFSGIRDPLFPVVGARRAVEEASFAHAALASKLGCTHEEHYCEHACPTDFREGVYRFFEQALKQPGDMRGPGGEGEDIDMSAPELDALPKRPPRFLTIPDLYRDKLRSARPKRPTPSEINRLLGRRAGSAAAGGSGAALRGRCLVRFEEKSRSRLLLQTGDGAVLPTVVRKGGNGRLVLAIGDKGKSAALKQIAAKGPVASFDWRGQGETTPAQDIWYQRASHYLSIAGKTLAGDRVTDLLTVAAWLRREGTPAGKIVAFGGEASLIALLAALAEPTLPRVELHGLLRSFKDAPGMIGQVPYTAWVPGLAALTDIPQMLAALGKRAVVKSWLKPGAERPREGYT